MFTGIIEDIGSIVQNTHESTSLQLKIETHLPENSFHLGDSVAIDGVCLTVSKFENHRLVFAASHETVQTTTLKWLKPNDPVHIERALPLGGRLGGHLVTGHVDGMGEVVHRRSVGPNLDLTILAPENIRFFLVPKGSIAVAGVSLTINQPEDRHFRTTLVPHTLQKTTLGDRRPGDKLNLEADILGKYVRHFTLNKDRKEIDRNLLAEHGFLTPDDV